MVVRPAAGDDGRDDLRLHPGCAQQHPNAACLYPHHGGPVGVELLQHRHRQWRGQRHRQRRVGQKSLFPACPVAHRLGAVKRHQLFAGRATIFAAVAGQRASAAFDLAVCAAHLCAANHLHHRVGLLLIHPQHFLPRHAVYPRSGHVDLVLPHAHLV